MNLFENPEGIQTRWSSVENIEAKKACAGLENKGAKGHALYHLAAGETKPLLDVEGSGTIYRMRLSIDDRSSEMLRSL